jgi:hypothetical protein
MIQAVFEGSFREHLLNTFKPKFSNSTLKADQFLHHVTLFYSKTPVSLETDELASQVDQWANDGEDVFVYLEELVWSDTFGVEAIVVKLKNIRGEFLEAPANKTWHITVSTEGKAPVESNTLLKNRESPDFRTETQSLGGSKVMAKVRHYK